jgi:hypothetical protein
MRPEAALGNVQGGLTKMRNVILAAATQDTGRKISDSDETTFPAESTKGGVERKTQFSGNLRRSK